MISHCTSDTADKRRRWRTVAQLEASIRRGLARGYCRPNEAKAPAASVPVMNGKYAVQMPVAWIDTNEFVRSYVMYLAMDCEEPFVYTMTARYDARGRQAKHISCDVHTRCRKCESCRRRKSMYWAGRAITEFQRNPSTYMVTLTMRPEMHYHFDAVMHERFPGLASELKASSDGLASATLFAHRARVIGCEVTKYLKRLRKRAPFRTMVVAEAHKEGDSLVAGRPHFHLLIHEVENGTLIQDSEWRLDQGFCTRCNRIHSDSGMVCDHAFVRYQWPHGFTKVVRCVDEKSVYYLCKYVSKAMMSRVRASQRYGDLEEISPTHNHGMIVSSSIRGIEKEAVTP